MKKMRSISTKFITSFLIIGLIPVVLFGLVSYYQLYNTTMKDKEMALRATAENKLLALDIWMDEIELKGHLIQNIQEIRSSAPQLVNQPKGTPAYNLSAQSLTATLRAMISQKDDYTGIYLFSTNGKLRYSMFESDIDWNVDLAE